MKKNCFIMFYVLLLCFFLLLSCGKNVDNDPEVTKDHQAVKNQTENLDTKNAELSGKIWVIENFKKPLPSLKEGDMLEISSLNMKNLIVNTKIKQNAGSDGQNELYAYLLKIVPEGKLPQGSYLLVETEVEALFFDLKAPGLEDELYACDVDGDKIDELIVHQAWGFTGGAGQYNSRIFKLKEKELCELFNSSVTSEEVFDTGFRSEFVEGKRIKIFNSITGYSEFFDLSQKYVDEFFDENGKGLAKAGLECDSFYAFRPKDLDGDGVFEIECFQYAWLDHHADAIGDAGCILKYNQDLRSMEVVESNFVS